MRTALLVCGTTLLLIIAGCSKDPQDAAIDTIDEISDLLDGVKTKEDAKRVKAKLAELANEMTEYGKQMQKQGIEAFSGENIIEMAQKSMEMFSTIDRLMNIPEVKAVLEAEFQKLK